VGGLFGLAAATLVLGLARHSTAGPSRDDVFNEDVVRQVRDWILDDYVEELDDFDMKLYLGALQGMTDVLDPHSQFLTPEQLEQLMIDTRGKFGGLGIVIEKPMGKLGPIIVITPFLGTPASKAGIQPGDRIVEIEGQSTIGIDIMEAVHKLRGDPGTEVRIKIQRPPPDIDGAISAGRVLMGSRLVAIDGQPMEGRKESDVIEILKAKRGKNVQVVVVPTQLGEPEEVVLERARIRVPVVEFARMADTESGIGYVRLARFQEDSVGKLRESIERLRGKGMRALVLDLRGNGGGLLRSAIDMAKLFLPRGSRIVSTRARVVNGRTAEEEVYRARENGPYSEGLPMAILVDGYSASASEILAAAVQDNKRGIIVGEQTFGKGSVQKPYEVRLGPDPKNPRRPLVGSLKLTIEKYYTPKGVSLQREPGKDTWGVVPTIEVKMTDAEKTDLRRQWEKDKIAEQNGEEVAEGQGRERASDAVLERAMENLKTVLVLGPGVGGAAE
jgi:carboxyl-terminal processing protease